MAKSPTEKKRDRRRATARRLAAEGKGVREIARELGVDPATISRDLKAPKPEGGPGAPPLGNRRAEKHGAHGEAAIAERSAAHEAELRQRYPNANPGSVRLQADRLARIDAATAWLAERGAVVKAGTDGDAIDIADRLGKWSTAAERWYERMDAMPPQRPPSHASSADRLAADPVMQLPQVRALSDRIRVRLAVAAVSEISDDPEATELAHELLRVMSDAREAEAAAQAERAEPPVDTDAVEELPPGDERRAQPPAPGPISGMDL